VAPLIPPRAISRCESVRAGTPGRPCTALKRAAFLHRASVPAADCASSSGGAWGRPRGARARCTRSTGRERRNQAAQRGDRAYPPPDVLRGAGEPGAGDRRMCFGRAPAGVRRRMCFERRGASAEPARGAAAPLLGQPGAACADKTTWGTVAFEILGGRPAKAKYVPAISVAVLAGTDFARAAFHRAQRAGPSRALEGGHVASSSSAASSSSSFLLADVYSTMTSAGAARCGAC
jgi:hypothetical protein